jgi:serralysin
LLTSPTKSATTYTLSENIENLILSGTGSINGTGNTLNNVITGNSGFNLIDGGVGNDTMIGGTGNDNYVFDSAGDVIVETSNLVTEIDTVFSSVNYTLPSNTVSDLTHYIENLILTGTANLTGAGNSLNNLLIGNSGNNTLRGNAGNDLLDGSLGKDTLEGGVGNDAYVIDDSGDVITEVLDSGLDTAKSYISNTLALANNVENLVLLGTENLTGTGNTLANLISGNSGNNDLKGGADNDTLIGGLGNDTLNGGIANDRLVGGSGVDQFYYNSGVVFSGADFGSDRIVDFKRDEGDKIVLGKTTFGLTSSINGSFGAGEFASVQTDNGAKASLAKVVYSSETGNIFYNSNGMTVGNESVLTTLETKPDFSLVSASDFAIV